MKTRAVFLDRDGVLNQSVVRNGRPYPPANIGELVLVESASDGLARLKERGFMLVVITNQPDVRRGTARREDVEVIHRFLTSKLPLDDFFVCFHDDVDNCACRKPRPGMLLEAASKHQIDLGRSYFIGDRWRDTLAGSAAGCRTIFIDHGYQEDGPDIQPDIRVDSLSAAVDRIIQEQKVEPAR